MIGIVQRQERVLVVRRSQQVIAPGMVCFPGGGLEAGESEPAGLRREFQEELALPIEPIRRIWQSIAPWDVELRWWLCQLAPDAQPQPNFHEVAAWWWEPWDALALRQDVLASNRQFLDALARGEISLDGGSI